MKVNKLAGITLGAATIALIAGAAIAAGGGMHGGMGGHMGAAAMIADLDTDGDGNISKAEIEAYQTAEPRRSIPMVTARSPSRTSSRPTAPGPPPGPPLRPRPISPRSTVTVTAACLRRN